MAAHASRRSGASRRLETAARRAAAGKKLVLAVSGGRDSMALMHAMKRVAPRSVAVVATFDHGTGPAASRAAAHVASVASALGFPAVVGRASNLEPNEAAWREARLQFLNEVATATRAVVATAHTRDDQIETVLMRVMRDSGARGLAGLFATGSAIRPLIDVSRDDVAEYARQHRISWKDDPTNASDRHLRNRVRRDLLPALERARPSLADELLELARAAAEHRAELEAAVAALASWDIKSDHLRIEAASLSGLRDGEMRIVWQAIAARIGVLMDWRGTERAAAFTTKSRVGARIPLTGGWEITRERDAFELRRVRSGPVDDGAALELKSGVTWKAWRFLATQSASRVSDEWVAQLPIGESLTVRRWAPGDRMRIAGVGPRKVKRFLSDAHVASARRGEWPVVLAGDEIVWIPGVRRSDAAAVRPGRPGVLYRCELNDH